MRLINDPYYIVTLRTLPTTCVICDCAYVDKFNPRRHLIESALTRFSSSGKGKCQVKKYESVKMFARKSC